MDKITGWTKRPGPGKEDTCVQCVFFSDDYHPDKYGKHRGGFSCNRRGTHLSNWCGHPDNWKCDEWVKW